MESPQANNYEQEHSRATNYEQEKENMSKDEMRRYLHSVVEKERRDKFKEKLMNLKSLIPTCATVANAQRLTIVEHAIAYIRHLENKNNQDRGRIRSNSVPYHPYYDHPPHPYRQMRHDHPIHEPYPPMYARPYHRRGSGGSASPSSPTSSNEEKRMRVHDLVN